MKKIIDAMDKGIGMLEKIVLFGSITVMRPVATMPTSRVTLRKR